MATKKQEPQPITEEQDKGKESAPEEQAKEAPAKEEKLKSVELEDKVAPPKRAGELPVWQSVEELSDDDMQVEAANLAAHGRASMLLRFRVGGKLTGQVVMVDRMHYRQDAKKRFLPK